ncbi:MAG: helix-turn-helix domain-containing protein [Geminicoccaceae bacterium]
MGKALTIHHGRFGRAAIYNLTRVVETHAHREGHLIFHMQIADSTMVVRDTACPIEPLTSVAINPWEVHSFRPGDSEGTLCLVLYVKPAWFLEMAEPDQSSLCFGSNPIEITSQIQRLVQIVGSLMIDIEESDRLDGYISELTQHCYARSWQDVPDGVSLGSSLGAVPSLQVRMAVRSLSARVGDGFALDEMAREAGLARQQISKAFREQTGMTPSVYLNTLRMERTIQDLTLTKKSLLEIGSSVGFTCRSAFDHFFSTYAGITPTNYRRVAHVAHHLSSW